MGIKSVIMFDYEYTEHIIFNTFSSFLLCPKYIPDTRLKEAGFNLKKIIKYNGFKEELYLSEFEPDPNFRKKIDVDENSILIIIRPPSITSNYHNEKSEKILERLIKLIKYSNENLFTIIVPRTKYDQDLVKKLIFGGEDKFRLLQNAVDGLQLLYSSDYVFSGGGTMNRESALLGTKTYSFFTGKRPYLDEYLSEMNSLNFINEISDIDKITFEKYNKLPLNINKSLTEEIVSIILDINKRK
jgi:predicted glycosyltransferase